MADVPATLMTVTYNAGDASMTFQIEKPPGSVAVVINIPTANRATLQAMTSGQSNTFTIAQNAMPLGADYPHDAFSRD